jgi:NAD(P)-dependent dehydrogenase (short-subunit alcohol dehydrogenase family)
MSALPYGDPAAGAASSRVVLVTGAAQRLGRAIALAMAQAGWDVAIHCHRSVAAADDLAAQIRALGRRAGVVSADLGLAGSAVALLDDCERQLGPLTGIVNNASRFERDEATDFTAEGLMAHMQTNLAAPLLLAQALHARLDDGRRGVIINLLDQKLWNPNPDFFSYTLSKAALEAATGLAARALAPRLRVLGLAPGLSLPAAGQSDADFAAAHRCTPLGRSSTAQDVAQAAVFLASADAVTGTTLLVDGGQHLLPTSRDIMFLAQSTP